MLPSVQPTYKSFFFLLLCLALSTIIPGCDSSVEEDLQKNNKQPVQTSAASSFQEAPMLANLVQQKKLPSVDKRLPANPMVVKTVERIGQYGGIWSRGFLGDRDQASFIRTLGYENLMRWNPEWTRPIPNVARSVKVSDDASTYTFYLRRNMRWSDGAPFTADDIMFWYENILQNPDFPDSTPRWLNGGRDSLKVIRIDSFTVRFELQNPDGLLLQKLAHPTSADPTSFPRHYIKQFLPAYNPDINALVKKAGLSDWQELFFQKVGAITPVSIDHPSRWSNPELPVLYGWVLENGYLPGTEQVTAVRNPYYWKIDFDGNQLPYIDKIIFKRSQSAAELLDWAGSGRLDMQIRHVAVEKNRQFLTEQAKTGGYHLFQTNDAGANVAAISLNLLHPDPILREIFQQKKFRMALSHALNREEIIANLYPRHKAAQVAPQPASPLYNKEFAKQYISYDTTLADRLLDEIGLQERDDERFRIMKDGRRLTFSVEIPRIYPDLSLLLENYIVPAWKKIGLEVLVRVEERSVLYRNKERNMHDAVVWRAGGGLDGILTPRYYFPSSMEANYAIPWGRWFVNQSDSLAQEPPAIVKKQMELYRKLSATANPEEQLTQMREILDISREQFYVLGICRSTGGYGIASNGFRNIPQSMPTSWTYPNPAPSNPVQYFIDGAR